MRNGDVFGPFPLGKKKIHTNIPYALSFGLFQVAPLQITLERTTQLLNLIVSEEF